MQKILRILLLRPENSARGLQEIERDFQRIPGRAARADPSVRRKGALLTGGLDDGRWLAPWLLRLLACRSAAVRYYHTQARGGGRPRGRPG